MPATAKKDVALDIPELKIKIMEVTLIGDTPLIVHAWSVKAKKEMLDKQTKKGKGAKPPKDPQADFEASLYRLEDGRFGFPSVGIKTAAVSACRSLTGIPMTKAVQAFHVVGELALVEGAFNGVKMRQDLVPINGPAPAMREDMVRVANGTADLRYRGEFWPWAMTVNFRFNQHVLSEEQIVTLFNTAGFGVGIGEWRPEKKGQSGMFHIADAGELQAMIHEVA